VNGLIVRRFTLIAVTSRPGGGLHAPLDVRR
jgi:hypothetical protein